MTADSNDDGDESQSDNRSSGVLAAGGTKKIIGKLPDTDGIGVFGYATGSGTTCGVRGKVDSASGYGLATPDDAKIDGTLATTGSHRVTVGGNRALRMDPESGKDAGSIIAGHRLNKVEDGAVGAVVAGGGAESFEGPADANIVSDDYGVVSGGEVNVAGNRDGDSTTAKYATVGGGELNDASNTYATVGGGGSHEASGTSSTVAGGKGNTASAQRSTVGGGFGNSAEGQSSTVAGGRYNDVLSADDNPLDGSTISGGEYNQVKGKYGTIAGGGPADSNDLYGTNNVVYDNYGTIGGGGNNQAGSDDGDTQDPTNATYATVSGGNQNVASDAYASVGGGYNNSTDGSYGAVAGGRNNTVHILDGAIGGGNNNDAYGSGSTIPGGYANTANGTASFAAGQYAQAEDENSFVWNDGSAESSSSGSKSDQFSSSTSASGPTGDNTFHVKSTGGVRFVTSADNSNVTYISSGSAGWTNTSTRAAKTNVDPVDTRDVLAGVEEMEITTWEYSDEDGQGQGERHIGPMAEDFHDAVDVGESDEHINSINADGVLFAALQGLSEKVDEKDEQIEELQADLDAKDERIDELEDRLAAIESQVETTAPADD